jgi:hypothetical protein
LIVSTALASNLRADPSCATAIEQGVNSAIRPLVRVPPQSVISTMSPARSALEIASKDWACASAARAGSDANPTTVSM